MPVHECLMLSREPEPAMRTAPRLGAPGQQIGSRIDMERFSRLRMAVKLDANCTEQQSHFLTFLMDADSAVHEKHGEPRCPPALPSDEPGDSSRTRRSHPVVTSKMTPGKETINPRSSTASPAGSARPRTDISSPVKEAGTATTRFWGAEIPLLPLKGQVGDPWMGRTGVVQTRRGPLCALLSCL